MLKRWKTGSLLSPRDWVYLLSLLIPFVVYNLCLKLLLILIAPAMQAPTSGLDPTHGKPQLLEWLGLMQSDLLFSLGYSLLWIGLFAVVRKSFLHRLVVVLLHVITIFIALLATAAFQFYNMTGLALDPNYLLQWIAAPDGTGPLIASGITTPILLLVLIVVSYLLLGPALLTYAASRWYGWQRSRSRHAQHTSPHWARITGIVLATATLFWASLPPARIAASPGNAFSRNAFVDLMIATVEAAQGDELASMVGNTGGRRQAVKASLRRTAATQRRNVVLIFFESTRADATTPYNPALQTTPFLQQLATQSLVAEQAYALVGHTHNALTATNCGIDPPLDPRGTAFLTEPGSVPSICLPHLLKKQGYASAFFMSHTKAFEDSEAILKNLGYDTFYSVDNMPTEGFEPTYYWGYEDEIMLEPSARWLQANKARPFVAAYLTSAPHHDYLAPWKRHGRVQFTENDLLNRYYNTIRNQDFFLKSLFDQYKRLGLYDNSIFVILGDHGEAFGEHGIYGHNMIYEEGLKVPLLVHDPQNFKHGRRVAAPVSQIDILPTVVELLGYNLQGGDYKGHSLLHPLPSDRTLLFSCWGDKGCLASLKGMKKYIYYFDDQPEQLFDLAADPAERKNLAGDQRRAELDSRRAELLDWYDRVRAAYTSTRGESQDQSPTTGGS